MTANHRPLLSDVPVLIPARIRDATAQGRAALMGELAAAIDAAPIASSFPPLLESGERPEPKAWASAVIAAPPTRPKEGIVYENR